MVNQLIHLCKDVVKKGEIYLSNTHGLGHAAWASSVGVCSSVEPP